MTDGIGPLLDADERFCHQITETSAVVSAERNRLAPRVGFWGPGLGHPFIEAERVCWATASGLAGHCGFGISPMP